MSPSPLTPAPSALCGRRHRHFPSMLALRAQRNRDGGTEGATQPRPRRRRVRLSPPILAPTLATTAAANDDNDGVAKASATQNLPSQV
jgi:hypothetical protein